MTSLRKHAFFSTLVIVWRPVPAACSALPWQCWMPPRRTCWILHCPCHFFKFRSLGSLGERMYLTSCDAPRTSLADFQFHFRNLMAKAGSSLYDASIRFRGTGEAFSNWLSGSNAGALSKQCDFMPPWTNRMRGCMFFLVCRTRSVEEMSQQVCKSWIRRILSLPSLSALDKVKVNKTKDLLERIEHIQPYSTCGIGRCIVRQLLGVVRQRLGELWLAPHVIKPWRVPWKVLVEVKPGRFQSSWCLFFLNFVNTCPFAYRCSLTDLFHLHDLTAPDLRSSLQAAAMSEEFEGPRWIHST